MEADIAFMEWTDEKFEEELCNLTPLQIHAYFQHKKQSASQITTKLKSNDSSLNYWHTSKGTYSTEQIEILKLDGKLNYYIAIDPKALRGLDSNLVEQFTTAIKKGIVSKDFSSTGINFIPGKLIEVKINGDDRIYAKKIFSYLK